MTRRTTFVGRLMSLTTSNDFNHMRMNTATTTNAPTLFNNMDKETMTSLEIAEVTGKQHQHVMRDIRAILNQGVDASNFGLTSYTDKSNRQSPCYKLTKKGCLILASGYDAILREKIINRWEELETKERNGGFTVPQTFAEALMLAAKQQLALEEKEKKIAALNEEQERLLIENTKQGETINEQGEQIIKLTSDISQMKPKVDYCDIILQSISTVLITQIAQDYGMSAVAFNKKLAELHIQHKVNNQWILYAPYVSMGYVQSKPVNIPLPDGTTKIRLNTEWTQKGRLFLYEKLKSNNIVPLIEK